MLSAWAAVLSFSLRYLKCGLSLGGAGGDRGHKTGVILGGFSCEVEGGSPVCLVFVCSVKIYCTSLSCAACFVIHGRQR